jgi:hypothetical protein
VSHQVTDILSYTLADPSIGNIGDAGDMWRSENVGSLQ